MNHVLRLVKDILEDEKRTAEEQLQLNKICELEDKFVKDFSKDKWKEYFDLDIEKGQLHNLEIDRVIELRLEFAKNCLLANFIIRIPSISLILLLVELSYHK